jgi:hypothetical protein
MFGCILFPDATGDCTSWKYIPCLTNWDTAGHYSWASVMLSFLYRHLCEACRYTSSSSSVGSCVYLLHIWMWFHISDGRPCVFQPRPWNIVGNDRLRPMYAYVWDQVAAPFARAKRAYMEYVNELDTLSASSVSTQHLYLIIMKFVSLNLTLISSFI